MDAIANAATLVSDHGVCHQFSFSWSREAGSFEGSGTPDSRPCRSSSESPVWLPVVVASTMSGCGPPTRGRAQSGNTKKGHYSDPEANNRAAGDCQQVGFPFLSYSGQPFRWHRAALWYEAPPMRQTKESTMSESAVQLTLTVLTSRTLVLYVISKFSTRRNASHEAVCGLHRAIDILHDVRSGHTRQRLDSTQGTNFGQRL
jgi:hypothetical protein